MPKLPESIIKSIENLTIGYIVTNADNEILLMNFAAEKLFIETKSYTKLDQVAAKLPERVDLMMHVTYCSREHKSCSFREVELGDKTVKVFLSPLFEGEEFSGNVVTMEDITESVVKEKARDQFLSYLVHELRTPLTAVSGNAYLARSIVNSSESGDDLIELIDDMHTGSQRLLTLVNQFLDMARLEEGRITYDLKEFNAKNIATSTVKELDILAEERNLTLEIDEETFGTYSVIGDPLRVGQILTNLIGNAIKYTDEGTIRVYATKHEQTLEISVTDTGPGIPADSQEQLFQKYFQASNNKHKADTTKSVGLGLYTAKLMAEGMGGSLKLAHSEPGKGTTFVLTLDIATPERLKLMQKQIYDHAHGVQHAQAAEHNMIVMRA